MSRIVFLLVITLLDRVNLTNDFNYIYNYIALNYCSKIEKIIFL